MSKLAALLLVAIALIAPSAHAQQAPGGAVLTLPDTAKWSPCEGTAGCEALVVHGDPATGPSHLLVRMAPNARIPLIRHASTEHFVVVAGTFVARNGGREVMLKPGAHWFVPEGVAHADFRCAGPEQCMFYESHDKPLVTTPVN
jgi:mannose-6-phosphate isomerase-like protein (cupin superfamily)